jgi:hypothetical protein
LAFPAGRFAREGPGPALRVGDAHQFEQLDSAGPGPPASPRRAGTPQPLRRSGRRRCKRGCAPTSGPGTPCRWSCRGCPTSVVSRRLPPRAADPVTPPRTPAQRPRPPPARPQLTPPALPQGRARRLSLSTISATANHSRCRRRNCQRHQ